MNLGLQTVDDVAQQAISLFLDARYAECEQICRKLRNTAPRNPHGHRLAGLIRAAQGERSAGFAMLRHASELAPENADIHRECARAAMEFENYPLAEMHYRAALDVDPSMQARIDLALCLIGIGKWQEGWRLYDARLPREVKAQKLDALAKGTPLWNGKPVGTLLVHAEAGYGDMIQFARWLPVIRDRGLAERIVYRVPRALAPLMRRLDGIQTATTDEPMPLADAWCCVMQLAYLSGCEGAEFTPLARFLERPGQLWPSWHGRRPNVGLVWGGSPLHARDKLRSLRADAIELLLRNTGADWHLLQKGPAAALLGGVMRRLDVREHITDRSDELTDWEATARVVEGLDLVVSIDSAPAHLAAAVGCPTWIMLGTAPEFRWPGHGDRSAWYDESVRLFRQERAGDFVRVAQRVNAALAAC